MVYKTFLRVLLFLRGRKKVVNEQILYDEYFREQQAGFLETVLGAFQKHRGANPNW
jgi:hypothetical protein